ncbi:hypothetical protein Q9L42_016285 [Methylomarinum sp. Ch1-1]|uniref:Uncharacterized protein n=1 Tax=Methylomarinum roseum TaxID=3067653 RepID=A0AAU7NSD9_9GAMM|nr:hypothetical protein [Methylomarinum sp. Ch1-1]MDP4520108.1 hypothetical protein [Methylomarinum sp. Ch1-1]
MTFKDRWQRNKARKAARKHRKIDSSEPMCFGFGWYSEEEWTKLIEVVSDRSELDDTYQDWEKNATNALQMLRNQGIEATKVMVKVADLQQWCQKQGRPIDGETRAEYVSHLLSSQDETT